MSTQDGIRVLVRDGKGEGEPRKGTYVADVTVYATFDTATGALLSFKEAEKEPEPVEGHVFEAMEGNPKIVLDDGDVVYGCQVWWEPEDTPENHVLLQKKEIEVCEQYLVAARARLAELEAAAAKAAEAAA